MSSVKSSLYYSKHRWYCKYGNSIEAREKKKLLLQYFFPLMPDSEVGVLQPDHEPQRVAGIFTEEGEPGYSVPEEFDGEDVNHLKGEGDGEGEEGEQDLQELSPNTADTMRKINPLTIADQVSQMFRKGNQKVKLTNKSGSGFRSAERELRGQETHGDQSLSMSAGSEVEDSPIQPGYVRQGVPRIVNKPRSNDYGYSVIVLAGDAVHLPIKVQGKSIKGQGRTTLEDKDGLSNAQNQGVYKTGEAEERIGIEERIPKKEVRVYKQFSNNPDFPVYDEDFNFVPDPFQGILDDNYRLEVGKSNQKPVENLRSVDDGMGIHRVHMRSDDNTEKENSADEKVACSSWGKDNVTKAEVLSPVNTDSDEN